MAEPDPSAQNPVEKPVSIESETRVPTNPGVGTPDEAPKLARPAPGIDAPPPSLAAVTELPVPPPDEGSPAPKEPDQATTNVTAVEVAPKKPSEPPTALPGEPVTAVALPRASSRPWRSEVDPLPPGSPPQTGPLGAYEALARAARLPDIIDVAKTVLGTAARTRSPALAALSTQAAEEAKLSRGDADTLYGNALKVLHDGPEGDMERALASALTAHAVAEMPRKTSEDEDRIAGELLWLATHTAFDGLPLLVRALGEEDANDVYGAIADRVRRTGRARTALAEAIVGASALATSPSARARDLAKNLGKELSDPILSRVLGAAEGAAGAEVRLEGEMLPAPRGVLATAFLALSGILFVVSGARFVARLALAYKRPTEILLTESAVKIKTRTEVLGKTILEKEHVIVRAGLLRVVREVRYPRAAFYAGLFALAMGSCVGVRTVADGARSASPSLLVVGLVVIALGIAVDFALLSLFPGARGRVRIAFVPKSGRAFTVGDLDPRRADEAIKSVYGR